MSKKDLTPSQYVFQIFGGSRQVAELLGLATTTVWRWSIRIDSQGNQGRVPDEYFDELLMHAKRKGLRLTARHLVYGARK